MDPLESLRQPPGRVWRFQSQPFHISHFNQDNAHAGPSSSRPTTPLPASRIGRASSAFFSFSSYASRVDKYKSEKLSRERYEAALRLKSTWDALSEKYGSIPPEEDDEIDLNTGRVVKDRGRLRQLAARDFGDVEEDEVDECIFGSDEDELGAWDDRSGLDDQFPRVTGLEKPQWTREDDEDLAAFMRAEASRRTPTRAKSTVDPYESESSSEDDVAVRAVSKPRTAGIPPASTPLRRSSHRILEVVIPKRSLSRVSSSSRPIRKSAEKATLSGLFTPPPSSPPPAVTEASNRPRSAPTKKLATLRDLFSPSSPPPRNTTRPMLSQSTASRNGRTKMCPVCRVSGGDRRKWAARCAGRIEPSNCPFGPPSKERSSSVLIHPDILVGTSSTPTPTPKGQRGRPLGSSKPPTDKFVSKPHRKERRSRHCAQCYEAGGERAEASAHCPGRKWRRFCIYGENLRLSQSAPDLATTLLAPERDGSTSSTRTPRSIGYNRRSPRQTFDDKALEPPTTPVSTLRRGLDFEDDDSDDTRVRSTSTGRRAFTTASASRRITSSHPDSATSIPPSRRLYQTKARNIPSHLHTPESTDSDRGMSPLTSLTKRKSIMRQSSELNLSRQGSVAKRARFSLQPGSPSSEPFVCWPGDDELAYPGSPLSYSHSSIESASTSYPREMIVRAADAGVHLGARPSGRLPESVERSIKMASDPSLGSNARRTFPTPPRSSGPASSPVPSTTSYRTETSRAKLMLPPPLPEKCYATPPLSSGSTSSRPRSRSISVATPTPQIMKEQPRVYPVTAPAMPKRVAQPAVFDDESAEWGLDVDAHDDTPLPSSSSTSLRHRSRSLSLAKPTYWNPSIQSRVQPATAPRARAKTVVHSIEPAETQDDSLEWGLDMDAGETARIWRESSQVRFLE